MTLSSPGSTIEREELTSVGDGSATGTAVRGTAAVFGSRSSISAAGSCAPAAPASPPGASTASGVTCSASADATAALGLWGRHRRERRTDSRPPAGTSGEAHDGYSEGERDSDAPHAVPTHATPFASIRDLPDFDPLRRHHGLVSLVTLAPTSRRVPVSAATSSRPTRPPALSPAGPVPSGLRHRLTGFRPPSGGESSQMGREKAMLELSFQRERETKNTVRFEEQVTDPPPVVGTLYLQKYALSRLGNPDCLRVTVEAAAAGAVRALVPVAEVAEAGS